MSAQSETSRLHSLSALLGRVAPLQAEASGDAMQAARLAAQAGPPELARALLALTGGLYDTHEARQLLGVQVSGPPRHEHGHEHGTTEEMFVRALAASLLAPASERVLPLPAGQASVPLPAGLSMIDAGSGAERWIESCERALASAHAAGQQHVTLACASWGAQQDALLTLRRHYGPLVGEDAQPISVLALEDVIKLLSAAWTWDLPRLQRLMSGPVILDGLYTLAPDTMPVMLNLLRDAAQVFGVSVAGLHGQPYPWPDQVFGTLEPRRPVAQQAAVHLERLRRPLTLRELAAALVQQAGDTLVVVSSRASAARLAGLLPGSTLLSSSLCPVHLADQVQRLQERRARGEALLVVATVLPPQALGSFEHVWHMMAPLAHLVEASELCRGTLRVVNLSDVAPQVAWISECQLTERLLSSGQPLNTPALQLQYHQQRLHLKANPSLVAALTATRAELNYASLAASLFFRSGSSVPVFIEYDAAAAALIASIRASGVVPQSALRYAAWLTPSEVERALRRRQAHSLGWALLWNAPYDPLYGLATEAVAAARSME